MLRGLAEITEGRHVGYDGEHVCRGLLHSNDGPGFNFIKFNGKCPCKLCSKFPMKVLVAGISAHVCV